MLTTNQMSAYRIDFTTADPHLQLAVNRRKSDLESDAPGRMRHLAAFRPTPEARASASLESAKRPTILKDFDGAE